MKLKINKKQASLFLIIILGSFLFAHFARADWMIDVVGGLCQAIVYCLGQILLLVMKGVIYVAQYSDFIHSPAVSKGWIIMRDVCNMFFVLILLVIAFATILKIEKYSYKKYLPKLILMAVLINFSKTICGLLIDVAQVVMLTFVNAFKTIAGGSLVDMLGITDWLNMKDATVATSGWAALGAYVFAVVYVIVALVVLVTMLMVLIMRIVMIWIYVVLSPMAYLLAAFPGGEQYSSRWWSDFTKNLVVGPILAFFIWLSFAAVSPGSTGTGQGGALYVAGANMDNPQVGAIDTGENKDVSRFGTGDLLIKFIISIGMLIAGLKISQEIGGAAGDMAGKGMGALNKGRSMVTKRAMGDLAAVTGYRYASGVMSRYRSQRKAKREEKYDLAAGKLASGIGKAKKAIAYVPNKAGSFIKDKTWGSAGAKARDLTKSANEDRDKLAEVRSNVKRKEGKVGDWAYDKNSDHWKNEKTGVQLKDNDFQTSRVKDDAVKETTSALKTSIETKENKAQRLRKKQAKIDKGVKYGLMGAGAVFGLATGGLGAGLVGVAAGMGAPKLSKKIKEAGETDLNIAGNYRTKALTEAKDKMKYESNEQVIATMDDASKNSFVRAAAAMEAMDRKLLSLDQVKVKKEEIRDSMGGKDKKTGEWKDKRVGSYVDNTLEKNYVGATKTFDDLESEDENKKQKTRRTVMDRVEQHVYTLDSMDTGSVEKHIDLLTTALKTKDFVGQYDGLKDSSKKDATVEALKNSNTFESKEKLGRIKDLDTAFGSDQTGKEKALGNFNFDDLAEVFRKGTKVQQDALKDAVAAIPEDKRLETFRNASNQLGNMSTQSVGMRETLGIPKPEMQATQPNRPRQNDNADDNEEGF